MNNFKLMFPIVLLLVGVLIFTTMQDTKVDNEVTLENQELVVNEPNKIGNLTNIRGKEINDVVKGLPRIDRVRVYHTIDTTKLYSFEENLDPFYKIMEDYLQLEVVKHDNISSLDIINNAEEKIRLEYLNHEQKENGVIHETPAFQILILDNKYIYNYYSTHILEAVNQEAFNNLLEGIKKFIGINYVEKPNVVSEESKENKESFVGETKELGKFYTVFEVNIGDSVKDLSEIDRIHVHQRETNSVYSFEEDEMSPFAKIMEELNQLEVTKLNSYVAFDNLILDAQKSIKISFYVHEQKENGAIYETSNLDLVIADSKYLYITYYDIFEVLDVESLEVILNQIQDIL